MNLEKLNNLKKFVKLEKLKIKTFKAERRQEGLKELYYSHSDKDTYEAMFNPESYSFKYENKFQEHQGINTSGRSARYVLTKARELSMKFIMDDSSERAGLLSGASSLSVEVPILKKRFQRETVYDQVEEFLNLTTRMDGDIHAPRFLRLEWGDLIYDCRVKSVDVKYTLFNRSGKAIRAELDVDFLEDIEPVKLIKQTRKSSPDLTHTRTVVSDDTLPLMAYRIYHDPSQYIRVAHANKINNFRKLKLNSDLKFPPIKESSYS